MKCPLGECFKQDTKPNCGRDVVPLLSDTGGRQEELGNGHHEHSMGSEEQLTCIVGERCLRSELSARHWQCQNREKTLPRSMSTRLLGKHEQKHLILYAGYRILTVIILLREMMPQITYLGIFWLVLMCPCLHGTCLTQQLNVDEECRALLGNTTNKTPSRKEIRPGVAVLAPSKLLESLIQVIPSTVLSLATAAVRSPS